MKRRGFIYGAGSLVAASVFLSLGEDKETENNKSIKRVLPEKFEQAVLKAIAYGLNAPNPHNTQAWKFLLISDTEMLFYVDESRLLTNTDPTTRQIHIGCGCFLTCCKIGMAEIGFETHITLFPEGHDSYELASIGKAPVASLSFSKQSGVKKNPLADQLFVRRTSRLMYLDEEVLNEDFDRIMELVAPVSTEINLVNEPSRLDQLLPILAEGMEVETYTYSAHEESRKWFRENDDRIEKERDGINLPGAGVSGIKKWIAERQLKGLKEEKWHAKNMNKYSLKSHYNKVIQTKGIVTVKTSSNTFQDWLLAGMEYARLQLASYQLGYSLHPLSQVLQEYKEMDILRLKFEQKMGVKNEEKIQMVARMGNSPEAYLSYRRWIEDMLV